jgi:Transglutaminase-like superfamily
MTAIPVIGPTGSGPSGSGSTGIKPGKGLTVPRSLRTPEFKVTLGLAILTIVAGIFFRPVFQAWGFLVPPLVGATVIAFVTAVLCDHFTLRSGEGALIQVVLAVASLPGLLSLSKATFGLPVPAAISQLIRSLIDGPAKLLTTPIPAKSGQELLVAPVASAWLGFVIGWLLFRNKRFGWSIIGPTLVVVSALAFGEATGSFLAIVSAVFLAGALSYVLLVGNSFAGTNRKVEWVDQAKGGVRYTAIAVLLGVVGAASGVARLLPNASRFTFREYRKPPFDPNALPSPLAEFGKYLGAGAQKTMMFSATGDLPKRWTLATLTSYDGRVWSVGDPRTSGVAGGEFELVGARLRSKNITSGSLKGSATVTIAGLQEPWLPMAGPGVSVAFGKDFDRLRKEVRYNRLSDTLVIAAGVAKGSQYALTWSKESEPAADIPPATAQMKLPDSPVKDIIQKKASEIAGGSTGREAVVKLKAALDQGFYSPGAAPGHSFYELSKLLGGPNSMVGNGEHYAALFGVLANSLGIETRVVVGFVPKPAVEGVQQVFGSDVQAWDEVVLSNGQTLVVELKQDPTKKPDPKKAKPKTQANKPPAQQNSVPSPEPDAPVSEPSKKDPKNDKKSTSSAGIPRAVLIGGGIAAVPLALLGGTTALVASLKGRRRRKRRSGSPGVSVSGAWEELLERSSEAGKALPKNATIFETSQALGLGMNVESKVSSVGSESASDESAAGSPDAELRSIVSKLAQVSERAAFHADGPAFEASEDAWQSVDQYRSHLMASATRWQRWKRTIDPRPLFRGSVHEAYSRNPIILSSSGGTV